MEWLLIIFYIALFSAIIYRFKFFHNDAIESKLFLLAYTLKLVCAWSYYWLYLHYNIGGDSVSFLTDGKYLTGLFSTNTKVFFEILTGTGNYNELLPFYNGIPQWFNSDLFYNDSDTLIRINALLNFITGGYYMVNGIWFAFFSMVGSTALFKLFAKIDSKNSVIIFAVIFFTPSVVFWTAGISKEAWLVFLLGIFLYSLYILHRDGFDVKHFIFGMIACYLLIYIKIYFFIALIPALVSFFLAYKTKKANPLFIYCGVYIGGIIILMLLPGFDFISYISHKQKDFITYTAFMQSKSFISIPIIENNWSSFFINTPYSLWNVFTRPYLGEAKSFFWLFPSVENILVFLLILAGLSGFRFNRDNASISYACLFYALSIFVLIGLTTPVIGSLLRYKAPLIPFFLVFFIFHFDWERLKARVKFLK